VVGVVGCSDPPDERIIEMAREQAARQAEQSRLMAKMQNEIMQGSRQLVEADAESRREMILLQRDLQTDQHEIGRQRDLLEGERQQIARQRYRDQTVAAAFTVFGLLLACALPLLLCVYVLRAVQSSGTSDAALTELLVREFTADEPRLLARPGRMLPQEEPISLSEADEETDDDSELFI
jgi:hypothetical protein